MMGEWEKPEDLEFQIQVTVNPEDKTIIIEDNGMGMTEEEMDEILTRSPSPAPRIS